MSINSTPEKIVFCPFLLTGLADLMALLTVTGISLSRIVMEKVKITIVPSGPKGRFELIPAPQTLRSMMDSGICFSTTDP